MTGQRHASLPVLVLALLFPATARAQEEQPRIEVDMTVITGRNPFLLPGDDTQTTAGEWGVRGKTTVDVDHSTRLDLDGRVAYRKYSRVFGDFVLGNARASMEHRVDEHLMLRTGTSYERNLPLEATVASIDSAVDPVNLQQRLNVDQFVRWRPDRRTTFSGMVAWTRMLPSGSSLLTQTDAVIVMVNGDRRVTERTTVGVEGQATFSHSEDGSDSRAGGVRLTGRTEFSNTLTLELGAGIASIRQDAPGSRRSGGSGVFTASGSLCYDPRRFRLCINGRLSPVVTSFDGIRREKMLNLRFDLRTLPKANFSIEADYRAMPGSRFVPGVGELADPEVMRVAARYDRQVGRNVTLQVGADYDRRTGIARQAIDSWTARIGATIRIPSL